MIFYKSNHRLQIIQKLNKDFLFFHKKTLILRKIFKKIYHFKNCFKTQIYSYFIFMENISTPIISIQHLKNQIYEYKYQVSKDFLANFPYSDMENVQLDTTIILEKSETLLRVKLHIEGNVTLLCDRSLDEFEYPISLDENMLYQFSEKTEWVEDNLMLLGYDTVEIDLSQLIYELVQVSVPLKKLHPRFENDVYEENADGEILIYSFSTDGIIDDPETFSKNANIEGEEIDNRWADLKKIMNN